MTGTHHYQLVVHIYHQFSRSPVGRWFDMGFFPIYYPPPLLKVLCYRPEETGGKWGMKPRNSYPSFSLYPRLNVYFPFLLLENVSPSMHFLAFIWNLGSQQRFLFVWNTMSWMSVEITGWLASWKLLPWQTGLAHSVNTLACWLVVCVQEALRKHCTVTLNSKLHLA